jgi:hypothetical protein
MRAAVKGTDQGADFAEDHELDQKTAALVPMTATGGMFGPDEAAKLIRRLERGISFNDESATGPTKRGSVTILRAMPLYHFAVHNSHLHDDPEGAELPDDEAARQWGLQIIRDLKKNNEPMWKASTIEVTDGDRQVWLLPFVGTQ